MPLMWAAAEGDRQCALLEWMISLARTLPLLDINGQVITSEEALTVGWEVLHNAMRSGSEFQGGFVRMDSQPRVSTSSVGCPFQRQGPRTHHEHGERQGRPRRRFGICVRPIDHGLTMTLHPALLQGGTRQLQAWLSGRFSMRSVCSRCSRNVSLSSKVAQYR